MTTHQREALMHLLWPDMPLKSAFARHAVASQALADGEFARAQHLLQQAIPVYEKNKNFPDLAGANSLTGFAIFGQGELDAARPHLFTGLKLALDLHGFLPLGETLMGIALLLADQGQTTQAHRLYELVWRYPRYSNSILYDGIAGQKICALTAGITPDELDAIAQQTAELDIWQEVAILLDELRAAGWEENSQHSTEN